MQCIKDCISHIPADITLDECCRQLTVHLSEAYQSAVAIHSPAAPALPQLPPEQRPAASVALFSLYHQQIWLIGDCQCLVDGILYENNKPTEALNAQKRSRVIHQLLQHETSHCGHPSDYYDVKSSLVKSLQQHDTGRDHIVNDIIASMREANKTYAVIDGTPIYKNGVRIISTASAHEIVLATDGYPFLLPTLEESEKALADLLATDPLCISRYQATKGVMQGNISFDDRSYIRIKLNPISTL